MRRLRTIALLGGICCLLPLAGLGQSNDELEALYASYTLNLKEPTPTEVVGEMLVSLLFPQNTEANSLQCQGRLKNLGSYSIGGLITLEAVALAGNGSRRQALGSKTKALRPVARAAWSVPSWAEQLNVTGEYRGTDPADWIRIECRALRRTGCRADPRTMCLWGNDRFKVQVVFPGGPGQVETRKPDWGWFTRPGASSPVVYVEMTNKCPRNDHFWLGLASLTGGEYTVVVEDMVTGETRSFKNPGVGQVEVYPDAMPTCP